MKQDSNRSYIRMKIIIILLLLKCDHQNLLGEHNFFISDNKTELKKKIITWNTYFRQKKNKRLDRRYYIIQR